MNMPKQNKQLSLEERTTINFNKPLSPDKIKDFLRHVSETLNCSINYNQVIKGNMANVLHRNRFEEYTSGIEGLITRHQPLTILAFSLFRDGRNKKGWYSEFDGIRFSTPPCYDLKEIELMDSIRNLVNDYFSKHI